MPPRNTTQGRDHGPTRALTKHHSHYKENRGTSKRCRSDQLQPVLLHQILHGTSGQDLGKKTPEQNGLSQHLYEPTKNRTVQIVHPVSTRSEWRVRSTKLRNTQKDLSWEKQRTWPETMCLWNMAFPVPRHSHRPAQ